MNRTSTSPREPSDLLETGSVVLRSKGITELMSDTSEESQTLLPTDNDSMMMGQTPTPHRAARAASTDPAPAAKPLPASSPDKTVGRSAHCDEEEEEPTCCICLEPYSAENPISRGQCSHHFHLPCLMEWKQRSNTCPMCCAETLYMADETAEAEAAADRAAAAAGPIDVSRDEEIARQLQKQFKRQQRRERRAAEERRSAVQALQTVQTVQTVQPVQPTPSTQSIRSARSAQSSTQSAPVSAPSTARLPTYTEFIQVRAPAPHEVAGPSQTRVVVTVRTTQESLPPIKGSSSSRTKPQTSARQKDEGQCIVM